MRCGREKPKSMLSVKRKPVWSFNWGTYEYCKCPLNKSGLCLHTDRKGRNIWLDTVLGRNMLIISSIFHSTHYLKKYQFISLFNSTPHYWVFTRCQTEKYDLELRDYEEEFLCFLFLTLKWEYYSNVIMFLFMYTYALEIWIWHIHLPLLPSSHHFFPAKLGFFFQTHTLDFPLPTLCASCFW